MAETKKPNTRSVDNTVYRRNGKERINTLHQHVEMTSKRTSKLFDFTVTEPTTDGSSTKKTSVMTVSQKDKKTYVKISPEMLKEFKGPKGVPLFDNETLNKVFNGDGLLIDKNSQGISINSVGDEIIIDIKGKNEGENYRITAGPTNISLEYGNGDNVTQYEYHPKNPETAIDLSMKRSIIESMLDKNNPNHNLFNPPKRVRDVPQFLVGMYLQDVEDNTVKQFGDFTITRCNFGGENSSPYCFIKQKNASGKDEVILFANGGYHKCTGEIKGQYIKDKNNNEYYLAVGIRSGTKPYIPIKIPMVDGKPSPEFAEGFKTLMDGTARDDQTPILEVRGKERAGKSKKLDIKDEGITIEHLHSFEIKDTREYSDYQFQVKSKKFDVYDQFGITSERPLVDPGPDDDGDDSGENGGGSGDPGDSGSSGGTNVPGDGGGNPPTDPTQPENPQPENPQPENPEPEEPEVDEAQKKLDELNKAREKEAEEAEQKKFEEQQKAKGEAFKTGMTLVNTVMGNSLSTIGVFLMICSMIPGVNFICIPAAIMAGIGLFQSTFADKLVFNPYRKIKQKVKEAEKLQDIEFEARDQFIENERELDKLVALSKEKTAVLDKMMYESAENGGNKFAKEFAEIFNTNGVGFIRGQVDGAKQLQDIGNLDNRIDMTKMLDQISKAKDETQKQQLIEQFKTNFFQDLDTAGQERVDNLFRAENAESLNQFVTALNQANLAQSNERALFTTQRDAILTAEQNRLLYLARTDKFSEQQRVTYFERYSPTIIQNITTRQNGSTEKLNEIINSVPEATRNNAIIELNNASQKMQAQVANIETQANENVEKQKSITPLVQYKQALSALADKEISTREQCLDASKDFINNYTLSYYQGYSDRFKQGLVASTNGLSNVKENDSVKTIAQQINGFVEGISGDKPSEKAHKLAEQQKAIQKIIEDGKFVEEIGDTYVSYQGLNDGNTPATGSLVADPKKGTRKKEFTLQAQALGIAKNRIIGFIKEKDNTANETTLAGYSTEKLLEEVAKYSDASENKTVQSSIDLIKAHNKYETLKNSLDISDDLYKAITGSDVKYDAAKKQFIVHDYKSDKKATNAIDEAEEYKKFNKYPAFRKMSDKDKQKVVMMSLGLSVLKEKAEYFKDPTRKVISEEDYRIHIDNYNKMESLLDKILTGKLNSAYDELAIRTAMVGAENVNTNYDEQSKAAARTLIHTLQGYRTLDKVFDSMELSEEQKTNIKAEVSRRAKETGEVNFNKLFSRVLQEQFADKKVDGKTIDEIMFKHFDYELINSSNIDSLCSTYGIAAKDLKENIMRAMQANPKISVKEQLNLLLEDAIEGLKAEGKTPKELASQADIIKKAVEELSSPKNRDYIVPQKSKDFDAFVKDLQATFDKRTKRNLGATSFELGEAFTDKELARKKKLARNGEKEYDDYIDLFASRGVSREELEAAFGNAKSKKEFNAVVDKYMSRIGIDKEELKKIKKHMARSGKTNEVDREYYAKNSKLKAMRNLLNNPSPELNEDNIKLLKELGLNEKELKALQTLPTAEEKSTKLKELIDKNTIALDRNFYKLALEVNHLDNVRVGNTELDRKSLDAKDNFITYQSHAREFNVKFKSLQEFIKNNPECTFTQEIINAFVKGDADFLKKQGVVLDEYEFNNLDPAMYDELGINLDSLVAQADVYPDLEGLSPRKKEKLKKKIKDKNHKLLEKLEKKAKAIAPKLEKETKKKEDIADKKEKEALEAKEKDKKGLEEIKPPVILTAFKTIGNMLKRRKEQEIDAPEAAHAAAEAERARQAEAATAATAETEAEATTQEDEHSDEGRNI